MTRLDSMPLFDELADGYDQLVPFFSTFGERLMDLLAGEPGWDLLDIGAGRGAVSSAAAARGFTVTATDAAPRMVAHLRAEHRGINALVMDAHRLDFKDDSFDIATASFVIHVVDDPTQVLQEVCRVVRPGGLVAMTVPGAVDDEGQWERFHQISSSFTPLPSRPPLARPTDVAEVFAQAGLTDLREESIEVRLPVDSPERLWDFQMSHGFAGRVRSFSQADQAEFKVRALVELERMHEGGGIVLHRGARVHLGRLPA